jgi:hypothetical protein
LAEELGFKYGRIFVGQRVTLRGESEKASVRPFARDAMEPETAFACAEHDVAWANVGDGLRANGDEVAGINGRDHAAALCDETNFAKAAQDFGGEIETQVFG